MLNFFLNVSALRKIRFFILYREGNVIFFSLLERVILILCEYEKKLREIFEDFSYFQNMLSAQDHKQDQVDRLKSGGIKQLSWLCLKTLTILRLLCQSCEHIFSSRYQLKLEKFIVKFHTLLDQIPNPYKKHSEWSQFSVKMYLLFFISSIIRSLQAHSLLVLFGTTQQHGKAISSHDKLQKTFPLLSFSLQKKIAVQQQYLIYYEVPSTHNNNLYQKMQKYEIIDRIGEGAYGVVLKCRCNDMTSSKTINQQGSENFVAMKQFKEGDENEIVKKTTMREVKVLKMLQHTNIVQLKEAFRKRGIVYLIFQFVPFNLLEVLEKSPEGLPLDLIRKLIYQLIKGLAYLHSLHIIHRDIKLQNLLIGYNNQLKICDFGFARQVKKTKKEQLTDYVATRWYRPPELLVGADYGKEIDMWAVGCIMGELVDGNPMFPGENELDQLFLIRKCLGHLTPQHQELFLKNPRFLGTKMPQINNLDTIEKRYLGKFPQKGLNLMKQLLRLNPSDRLTANQALKHPYFEGLEKEQLPFHKLSIDHEIKTESRLLDKEDFLVTNNNGPSHKKYTTNNVYNPPLHTQEHREKTEGSQGQGMFTHKNAKIHIKKNKKDELLGNSKAFQNYHNTKSKSVVKGKANSKLGRQKHISLDKHKVREAVLKTQAGFYMMGGGGIIYQKQEEEQESYHQYPQYRNKIYNIRSPKTKSKAKRSNISTEEIQEEDNDGVWQSTGQLPFLMISSHKSTQNRRHKLSNNAPPNIIITNSTFNYKHS